MSNNLNFLLPTYTRSEPIRRDTLHYNNFSYLHVDPVNPLHIIFPEYERGGMDTRQYVKSINGTNLEHTVKTALRHNIAESTSIKPEHFIKIGKIDSPLITYNKLLNIK